MWNRERSRLMAARSDGFFNKFIYFCADGHLRVSYKDGTMMLPIENIQKERQESGLQFMISCMNCDVVFEEGLTLRAFFNCFKPWSDEVSLLTKRNMAEYLLESEKPSINKVSDDDFLVVYETNVYSDTYYGKLGSEAYISSQFNLGCGEFLNEKSFQEVLDMPLYFSQLSKNTIKDSTIDKKTWGRIKLNPYLKTQRYVGEGNYCCNNAPQYSHTWDSKRTYKFREVLFEIMMLFSQNPPKRFSENEAIEEFYKYNLTIDRKKCEEFWNDLDSEVDKSLSREDRYYMGIVEKYKDDSRNRNDKAIAQNILPIINISGATKKKNN